VTGAVLTIDGGAWLEKGMFSGGPATPGPAAGLPPQRS